MTKYSVGMKNREYIANQLLEPNLFDDGGSSYEAMVYYNIECPYYCGDKRAHCFGKRCTTDKRANRQMCFRCKEEWLDQEVEE